MFSVGYELICYIHFILILIPRKLKYLGGSIYMTRSKPRPSEYMSESISDSGISSTKLTLLKTLSTPITTRQTSLKICGRHVPFKIAAPSQQESPHVCKYSKAHTVQELACVFLVPFVNDFVTNPCKQQAQVIQNHVNEYVRTIS